MICWNYECVVLWGLSGISTNSDENVHIMALDSKRVHSGNLVIKRGNGKTVL